MSFYSKSVSKSFQSTPEVVPKGRRGPNDESGYQPVLEDNVVGEHILLVEETEDETEEDANEEEVETADFFEDEADENRNQPLNPTQTKLK